MKAIIKLDVPDYQIGQEVSIYFKDTMMVKGVVENNTGEWVQDGEIWEENYKCSKCGKPMRKILVEKTIIGHWSDFCPECGADMRKGV